MKYYRQDTLGDTSNEDYCFTDRQPTEISAYDLKTGARISAEYPDGHGDVALQLGEDYQGLEIPSFIGNTNEMFACSKAMADAILKHSMGEIEVVPFVLLNHRGRKHSEDCVFLNPVGTVDVLNMDATECRRRKNGQIAQILKFVLDAKKVAKAPDLFRPREDPGAYFLSEKLVLDLKSKGFTNLVFEEIEVR